MKPTKSPYRVAKQSGVGSFTRLTNRMKSSKRKTASSPRPADSYRGARRNAWFGR